MILHILSAKLGQCGRCMRISARGAAVGWALVGAFDLLGWPAGRGWVVFALPLVLTALWLAHIAAFAVRSIGLTLRFGVRDDAEPIVMPRPAAPPVPMARLSRRFALRIFGEAAGVAVLVSLALPFGLVRTCAQLPVCCSSGSDCTCSGCCGEWKSAPCYGGICQPSC